MRKLTLLLLIFIFLILFSSFIPQLVYADVVNPEYYSKKCNAGEIEVTCSYSSEVAFGPHTYDECGVYENNPNYRFLVGEGHSFGGGSKYCFKPLGLSQFISSVISSVISKIFPQLTGTLLIELLVFVLFGFRKKREIAFVALANILSVIAFAAVGLAIQMGFLQILIMELIIIVFETFFIFITTHKPLKLVTEAAIIANILSATLGTELLMWIPIISI